MVILILCAAFLLTALTHCVTLMTWERASLRPLTVRKLAKAVADTIREDVTLNLIYSAAFFVLLYNVYTGFWPVGKL